MEYDDDWGEVSNSFATEVKSGDMRRALIALRDYLVGELSSNRCSTCRSSKLRTGDQAALVLRLTETLKKIEELPDVEEDDELARIRKRRDVVA